MARIVCSGVLTTLSALGWQKELAQRDLDVIRCWRPHGRRYIGQDAVVFNEKMMRRERLWQITGSEEQ
eukprot:g30505.t1